MEYSNSLSANVCLPPDHRRYLFFRTILARMRSMSVQTVVTKMSIPNQMRMVIVYVRNVVVSFQKNYELNVTSVDMKMSTPRPMKMGTISALGVVKSWMSK